MQIERSTGPGRGLTLLGHHGLTTRKTGLDKSGEPQLFDHLDRDRQADALGLIQMLGADAELDGRSERGRCLQCWQRDSDAAQIKALCRHCSGEKIHPGRADEARHERIVRIIMKLHRRTHLLHLPRPQHHDLIGQRHRLGPIMGDLDDRIAKHLMQLGNLHPCLHRLRSSICGMA